MSRVHRPQELPETIGMRAVLGLAWPIIVSMLSFTVMGLADAVFVGWLGTEPLAAIGASLTVVFLARAYGYGLLGGVRVLVSQRTGAEDHAMARRLGWQGLWLAALLGGVAWLLLPLGEPVFAAMGTTGEVRRLAAAYFAIRLFAAPADFGMFALSAWFQGRGDTRTPMVANVTANALNVVLDVVLIFGVGPVPALGVAGAAWATNIARVVGALWLLVPFLRRAGGVDRRLDRGLLRRVARLGHPLGTMDFLEVGAFTAFTAILATVGEVELAAHVVVLRIISVSFLPGHAIGSAAGVLVGQAVGAGRPDLARQAVRSGLLLAVGVMAACGVVFLTSPGPLLWGFGVEPAVEATGRRLLAIAASFQLFDAAATVLYQSLTGAGDTRFVMRTGVAASWVIKLPLAWGLALPLGLGAVGAWMAFDAELAVVAAVFAWRVRSGRWLEADPAVDGAPATV